MISQIKYNVQTTQMKIMDNFLRMDWVDVEVWKLKSIFYYIINLKNILVTIDKFVL